MRGNDQTDIGIAVNNNDSIQAETADPCDSIIAIFVIGTFIADIVTDIILAYQFYQDQQWLWFTLTVIFIVLPSLVMQIFSWVLFRLQHKPLSTLSIVLHILQLGPVERYFKAFYYGTKTLCVKNAKVVDVSEYLKSWRDVAMLRLIETSMESGPQLILQLYILSTYNRAITLEKDYIVIISALISLFSLAVSVVSYTNSLRLHDRNKGLSICGYIFQMAYRIFIILSRIVAFTLFAMAFNWWLLFVVLLHWIIMVVSLVILKTSFCERSKRCEKTLEFLFRCVLGFIYVFCFLTPVDGKSRFTAVCYYTFLFVENSLLIAVWYPTRRKGFHILEYGAICFVWGGFFIGLLLMLLYYKFFHPKHDVTAKCTDRLTASLSSCCLVSSAQREDDKKKNIDENSGRVDEFDVVRDEEKYVYNPTDGKISRISNGNAVNSRNVQYNYSDSTFV